MRSRPPAAYRSGLGLWARSGSPCRLSLSSLTSGLARTAFLALAWLNIADVAGIMVTTLTRMKKKRWLYPSVNRSDRLHRPVRSVYFWRSLKITLLLVSTSIQSVRDGLIRINIKIKLIIIIIYLTFFSSIKYSDTYSKIYWLHFVHLRMYSIYV